MRGQETLRGGAAVRDCAGCADGARPRRLPDRSSVQGLSRLAGHLGSRLGGPLIGRLSQDGGIPSPLKRCKLCSESLRYGRQCGSVKCQCHCDVKVASPSHSEKPNIPLKVALGSLEIPKSHLYSRATICKKGHLETQFLKEELFSDKPSEGGE